jgi:creatinine amidohydrolase
MRCPRDRTLLVLPTAAIEQHGHHLPLATDTLINNLMLGHALQKTAEGAARSSHSPRCCYGKSNEHVGYPWNAQPQPRDLHRRRCAISAASLHAAGFQKLVFFNSHGGNHSLLDVMARDLREEFGLRTFCLYAADPPDGVNAQEAAYGFHAGEVETAAPLAATPELVHTDQYTVNYIAKVGRPGRAETRVRQARTYAWLTRDIAPSGVMGDPASEPRPRTDGGGATTMSDPHRRGRWWRWRRTRISAKSLDPHVRKHDDAVNSPSPRLSPENPPRSRPATGAGSECGSGVTVERDVRLRLRDGTVPGVRPLLPAGDAAEARPRRCWCAAAVWPTPWPAPSVCAQPVVVRRARATTW